MKVTFPVGVPKLPDTTARSCTVEPIGAEVIVAWAASWTVVVTVAAAAATAKHSPWTAGSLVSVVVLVCAAGE